MPIELPPTARRGPRRWLARLLLIASLCSPGAVAAADPGPALSAQLIGETLSAITYVPRERAPASFSDLSRVMFQAYLEGDGRALVRVWDTGRNSYTPPSERRWTLRGTRLCLDLPAPGPGLICAEVHVWGPRIAGVGVGPYVMLDGDLKRGNVIAGTR